MASADYLKKYISDDKEKKKKKKKNDKYNGLKVVEDDAFIPVESTAGKTIIRDDDDDDDDNEAEIREKVELAKKLQFRSDTFVTVEGPLDEEDASPERRRRPARSRSPDASPPRRGARNHTPDPSPPRRGRNHTPDASPKRRNRNRTPDASPPRRRQRESPHRGTRRRSRSRSRSPKRRRGETSGRHDDSDPSPPRRSRKGSDSDASPPRPRRPPAWGASKRREATPEIQTKAQAMRDGKKSGLVSAKEMREEAARLKLQKSEVLGDVDDEISGRNAETKIRTAYTGKEKKLSKEDEARKRREEAKNAELQEKYERESRGVAQLKEREKQLLEEERVMKEGFARYADDDAMNEHLRDQLNMEEDPMAKIIAKKKQKIEIRKGLVYPSYKGHWPPNRFSIPPGYRWDGVNRSNGFEAKLALTANKREADEKIAYRSIVELTE